MPVTLSTMPQSVQQVLGPEATQDLVRWLDGVLAERAARRDKADELLTRLGILEHDVSEVAGAVADLSRTMGERLRAMTRWTVGAVVLFGVLISVLLAATPYM
jgi:hypothetical protein